MNWRIDAEIKIIIIRRRRIEIIRISDVKITRRRGLENKIKIIRYVIIKRRWVVETKITRDTNIKRRWVVETKINRDTNVKRRRDIRLQIKTKVEKSRNAEIKTIRFK